MALKAYRQQGELWGPSPDVVVGAGHVARAINEIIESLGLERLNRRYEHTPGEAAYDVRMLCKVIIYANNNGYYSDEAVLEAAQSPTQCYVPDGYTAAGINHHAQSGQLPPYHVDRFEYDEEGDCFICPEGKRLEFYKNHQRRGSPTVIYRATECKNCPVCTQCTVDITGYRTIEVHREHKILRKARERLLLCK